jgi:hypothetical protein
MSVNAGWYYHWRRRHTQVVRRGYETDDMSLQWQRHNKKREQDKHYVDQWRAVHLRRNIT